MANILIVDDATIMRANIKKIFQQLGHIIIGEAKNGYEAIEQYKTLRPDLVTMDVNMPNYGDIGDGIDTVKHIIKINKDAKIIMITSYGEQEKVIRAIQNGASNYILKPVEAPKLIDAINKIL
jgi:two-component system chemotaxis response regulator CheY